MQLAEASLFLGQALTAIGIEAQEAQAELRWIWDHLGISVLSQRLEPVQTLSAQTWQAAQTILARRQQREPLQYILGSQPFCNLELKVTPDVLIPRPETEELVILALQTLPPEGLCQIADLGTGSGAIALALAQALQARRQPTQIWASDISAAALAVAAENARLNQLETKVNWLEGDGLKPFLEHNLQLDLLISNPPYIPEQDWLDLAPEVKLFEPRIALTPGQDPLYFYRLLASQGPHLLKQKGWLWVELDATLAAETQSLFQTADWVQVTLKRDYGGRWRFLTAQRA
jgi:release factor glutamine methyltransferase